MQLRRLSEMFRLSYAALRHDQGHDLRGGRMTDVWTECDWSTPNTPVIMHIEDGEDICSIRHQFTIIEALNIIECLTGCVERALKGDVE